MNARFVSGLSQKIFSVILGVNIFLIVWSLLRSWSKAKSVSSKLQIQLRQYRGPNGLTRTAMVGGHLYWDMYAERWPSKGFARSIRREALRTFHGPDAHVGLRNVLFGITTKCALRCEHCYEWENLNKKEKLSLKDLDRIVHDLIDYGATQIHLGGGEPMMRFDDIIWLLNKYSRQTAFWVVTSGFQVNDVKARALKAAGLAGLCVSIDHHIPGKHESFRHYKGAYQMATSAVGSANRTGLITSLSLCATREYSSEENIMSYMSMAKNLGVSFVQILEPRAVGHYDGQLVQLDQETKKKIEDIFLKINNDEAYMNFPVVIYHEYYRNTLGCRGAGSGSLYIDPLGNVHACPFCRSSVGNLLDESVKQCVDKLRAVGCHVAPLPKVQKRFRVEEAVGSK